MKNIKDLTKDYQKLKTKRYKDFYLERGKYILHFCQTLRNGSNIYKCKYYKDKIVKCKAYAKFNKDGNLEEVNNENSYKVDEVQIKKILIQNEVKSFIKEHEDIYNIKAKDIFDSSAKKIFKRKSDKVPEDEDIKKDDNHINIKGNTSPSFLNVKTVIYNFINKNLPEDVDHFSDQPEESEFI